MSALAARPAPLIAASDLRKMPLLMALAAIAWIAPERAWRPICRVIARLTARRHSEFIRERDAFLAERMKALPTTVGHVEIKARAFEESLQVFRCHRPGGWRPTIRLTGQKHIDVALAQGNGVILWVGLFFSHSLVVKMALHQAGFAVTHLSHPDHGFSPTKFGVRFLNPIQTSVEDRYLSERVLLSPRGMAGHGMVVGALRVLRRRLDENGVVTITATDTASQVVEAPFLGQRLRLPTGPAHLASTTGAALLPVFLTRTGPGAFEVHVDSPLDVGRDSKRSGGLEAVLSEYAARLEPYVARDPGQWFGWGNTMVAMP